MRCAFLLILCRGPIVVGMVPSRHSKLMSRSYLVGSEHSPLPTALSPLPPLTALGVLPPPSALADLTHSRQCRLYLKYFLSIGNMSNTENFFIRKNDLGTAIVDSVLRMLVGCSAMWRLYTVLRAVSCPACCGQFAKSWSLTSHMRACHPRYP